MHIRLINPNSTKSMTEQAYQSAVMVKNHDTILSAVNPSDTPVSIEGYSDEAMALGAMLKEIKKGEAEGVDAYIIACFDDPGLNAAREIAKGPVIGICQAAVQVAMTISKRFSIITTLPRSIPIIEDLVHEYGADKHCRKVRAINLPVLAIEEDPIHTEMLLTNAVKLAHAEDDIEAIILGCAGMSSLCQKITENTGIVVIDGVCAATKMAEALVGGKYYTSKINSYNYPRRKHP